MSIEYVDMKPLPQFRGFWEKHRYKVAVSGRASGKSVAASDAAIFFMREYTVKILQARQFMNSIADSSYQQVVDRIHDYGLEDEFDIQKTRIICVDTGSEMIFKGLERNIASIKSIANIDITIVEEAETVNAESWKYLIPTIMRNKQAELWVLFNPRLPTDATAELFLGEHPPRDMILMRANYDQNPYLPTSMLNDINDMKEHFYEKYLHIYEGQFESVGDNKMFPYKKIRESVGRESVKIEVPAIAALDVSRYGEDLSVLCVRRGYQVDDFKTWGKISLDTLAVNVANEIMSKGIKFLVVDGVGVGGGLVDMLKKSIGKVCRIIEFNGGYKANDPHFFNARADTYNEALKWLDRGCLPNHPSLIKEMSSIEYKYNSKNQLQIEAKSELKKRLGVSPDYLDAFTMSFFRKAGQNKVDLKKLTKRKRSSWT